MFWKLGYQIIIAITFLSHFMVNHSVSEICISVSKNTEIDLNKKSQKNPQFFRQCCGAGAAWSHQFWGGSGAGADFLVGRSREPEPLYYGGSGSSGSNLKIVLTSRYAALYEISLRLAKVTRGRLRSQKICKVPRGWLRSQKTAEVTRGRLRS